jgi:hypothetical protein
VRIPKVLVMSAQTACRLRIATLKDFIVYARAHPARLRGAGGACGALRLPALRQAATDLSP